MEDYGGNTNIVKAAPKPRQHFFLFLQVDRNRVEGNQSRPLLLCIGNILNICSERFLVEDFFQVFPLYGRCTFNSLSDVDLNILKEPQVSLMNCTLVV